MSNGNPKAIPTFPCVVQVGFAGSRQLFDPLPPDSKTAQQWETQVQQYVETVLQRLRKDLNLKDHHFFCGISQIACGADFVFTRACHAQNSPNEFPQRIFLPQQLDEYLNAVNSHGVPDFTPAQKVEARRLLGLDHIIQQRVVSLSSDRIERFKETNAEILRFSDVVVCLLRDNAQHQPGGSVEFLERAKKSGIPVLDIRISTTNGQLKIDDPWRHEKPSFTPKKISEPVAQLSLPNHSGGIPSIADYYEPLKNMGSSLAKQQQAFFRLAAAWIIVTHIAATVCATIALALHGHGEHIISVLLGFEIVLLGVGFLFHHKLHHSKAASVWANARVVAELVRSIRSIVPRHMYLEHLFQLQLPARYRPLLRTLNVLYLRSTYGQRNASWTLHRKAYLKDRIGIQVNYYGKRLKEDLGRKRCYRSMFIGCTLGAGAATLYKLLLARDIVTFNFGFSGLPSVLGTLAIVLPVLAVAGLSWAAALDCEARVETFRETRKFLKKQRSVIKQANTAAEYDRLLLETETVLLGETTNWFSRRATTGVN
jgi:SMODS and SLOG-associating 2TM effector domain 1